MSEHKYAQVIVVIVVSATLVVRVVNVTTLLIYFAASTVAAANKAAYYQGLMMSDRILSLADARNSATLLPEPLMRTIKPNKDL